MKEQILTALKAKFTGVNANILDRIATSLAKTVTAEDQVATAVEGVTKDFIDVIEAYGDSRATETQKTAIQNYEKKYGLKDGEEVNVPSVTPKEPKNEDTPDWAKALIVANKQLTDRLNTLEVEKTSASRKAELDASIAKLPETLRKGYSRISVDNLSDDDFNALKGEIITEIDGISKEINAKGAVFGKPVNKGAKASGAGHSGEAGEATESEAAAVVDKFNI